MPKQQNKTGYVRDLGLMSPTKFDRINNITGGEVVGQVCGKRAKTVLLEILKKGRVTTIEVCAKGNLTPRTLQVALKNPQLGYYRKPYKPWLANKK